MNVVIEMQQNAGLSNSDLDCVELRRACHEASPGSHFQRPMLSDIAAKDVLGQ